MNGIAGLLTSKKGSLALIAALLLTLVDPTVATFLPKLTDVHVICVTVIVGIAIVCQCVVDIVEIARDVEKARMLEKQKQQAT